MLRHAKRNGVHQPSVNRVPAPLKPSEVQSNAPVSFFSEKSTQQQQILDEDRAVHTQEETSSLHSRQNTFYLSSQEPMSPSSSFMSPTVHDASPSQCTFVAHWTSPGNETNDSMSLRSEVQTYLSPSEALVPNEAVKLLLK